MGANAKVTKTDIVDALMTKAGMTRPVAEKALNTILDEITGNLLAGKDVTLTRFGTFSVQDVKEREGKNPRTGEPLTIEAHKRVRFTAGKTLADAIR